MGDAAAAIALRRVPTPAAGASCGPSAGGSSSSTRRAGSPPSPPPRWCSTSWPSASCADLHDAHDHFGGHGRGATKRRQRGRWGVAGNIVTAWIITIPGGGDGCADVLATTLIVPA